MSPTAQTIAILSVGIVVVIGGVLVLRLHAFLALILGALAVAALTPKVAVQRSVLGDSLRPIKPENVNAYVNWDEFVVAEKPQTGELFTAPFPYDPRQYTYRVYVADKEVFDAANKLASQSFVQRVTDGFGSTCGKIGILIAMASIIGKCLLDSGAADRIVRSTLKLFGERGAPLSFLTSGFLLGIPVFFDTVFYLMIPLGKAMRMRTGRNYLLYVLTIVAGATMAHSLVPPTPGPLFVAEQLNVPIGEMILAGMIVGLFTSGFGYVYATFANRIWELPLRPSSDFSLEDLEEIAHRDESQLPPTWLSLLPIVLPVILIGGATVVDSFPELIMEAFRDDVLSAWNILGDKNIALILSATIAMAMLVWQKRTSLKDLSESIQAALASGGVIILITAGGGAFGGVLKQTGVANLISDVSSNEPWVIVALAFLITTAIRTAQGSATVAMITAVGILGGIATPAQLGFHPVYLALAIGCGSKPIAWMNDSGFWVIGKMSGMTEGETLKYVTPMTTCMGLVGLAVVMVGVTVFPMV